MSGGVLDGVAAGHLPRGGWDGVEGGEKWSNVLSHTKIANTVTTRTRPFLEQPAAESVSGSAPNPSAEAVEVPAQQTITNSLSAAKMGSRTSCF